MLNGIKTYFQVLMDNLGYREWEDGFAFDNIPSTVLTGSYHLTVGGITSAPANQRAHEFIAPLTVRLFLNGYDKPAQAIDDALAAADTILSSALDVDTRLGGDTIKDVAPDSIEVVPYAGSNDNAVILEMVFNFNLINCY